MTAHTPLRTARSVMTQRGANEVILLNSGSYPGFSNFLNESFTFNGTDWSAAPAAIIDPLGPLPCRVDACMSYDGTSVVLFGGRGPSEIDGILGDTWNWSGTAWSKLAPVAAPTNRAKAEMTYLASNTSVIMFGGVNQINMLNETWSFAHGGTWTKINSTVSPPARYDFSMASSPTKVILFGGKGGNLEFNDTWVIDSGSQWTQLSPVTSPSIRSESVMTYDTANSNIVMFGGRDSGGLKNDTWTYNIGSNVWQQKFPTTIPAARASAQMCYDSQSGSVIMFGGYGNNECFQHTYQWTGSQWNLL